MFNRPLFEEHLRGCITGCAWGTVLTVVGFCGLLVGLTAVAAFEASGAMAIAVFVVFGACAAGGIVMLVGARGRWRNTKTTLGFGTPQAHTMMWRDPRIAFDRAGWAHLSAEGGCIYCGEPTPAATRTIRKNIISARAEKSRRNRQLWFGIIGALTVDPRDLKGREASGLARDAKGVTLSYRECEPCRSARPNLSWMWGAFAAGLALGLTGIVLAGTEALGSPSGRAGWAYLALIAVPLAGAFGFLLGALVTRDYGNPVQFAKADVNEGLLINLPPHLSVQAASADIQARW